MFIIGKVVDEYDQATLRGTIVFGAPNKIRT